MPPPMSFGADVVMLLSLVWLRHLNSGVYVGSKQQFEELLKFVETKGLRPHIDKVFKFEDTVKAIEYLGSGQHSGKIVVKVAE